MLVEDEPELRPEPFEPFGAIRRITAEKTPEDDQDEERSGPTRVGLQNRSP